MKMSKKNISGKKIFDFNLFKEGFRQLKVLGFISLIIYIIEAILVSMNEYELIGFTGIRAVNLSDIHPIAYLTFIIVAPLFSLYLFGFLNSKTSSDFYHSLPHTRTCIITSFTAAIVSWIFIILASSSALAIGIHACFPNKYNIAYREIFMILTGIFIASLLVTSATVLACCITGTLLTNIAVTGIILFFPCFMAEMFKYSIMAKCGFLLSSKYVFPSLTGRNNLVTSLLVNLFFNDNSNTSIMSSFTQPFAYLYTFCVSAILFGLAIFFFNKRKSETAGSPAPNKYVQALYRMCITIALCMFPILMIFGEAAGATEIITIYVIIVVIYFLFEIITTKTVKRVIKIIPGLIVIGILNVALIVIINLCANNAIGFMPDSDDISYIKIIPSDESYVYTTHDRLVYEYFSLLQQNIKIQDEDIFEYVSKALSNTSTIQEYQTRYLIEIHTKDGKTRYRNIPVRKKLTNAIDEYYVKNSNFSDYISTLPEYNSVSLDISDNIKGKDLKELYNTLREEYESLSDSEKYNVITGNTPLPNIASISITFNYKGQTTELWFPITGTLPKTLEKYVNIKYESDDTFSKAKKILNDLQTYTAVSATNYISVSIEPISPDERHPSIYSDFSTDDFTDGNATAELYKKLSEYIPTTPDDIIKVLSDKKGYYYIAIDTTWDSFICIVPVNDETTNIFTQLEVKEQND